MKRILVALLLLVGATALVRDTLYQGQDFEVFWTAAINILALQPVYSLSGPMVFKYPPWIAVLFVPFGLLSLFWAKLVWGTLQVLSLIFVVRWLRKFLDWAPILICLFSFWGIWAVHALDGQVTLVWMAGMLFLGTRPALAPLLVLFSFVKIYTVAALPGFLRHWNRKVFGQTVFALLVLTYPVYLAQGTGSLPALLTAWFESARSGDSAFGIDKTFGRENQGLPALAVRLALGAGLNPEFAGPLSWVLFGFFFLALATFWYKKSLRLKPEVKTAGWLALVPLVAPLSWFHGFVLAFPLACLAAQRNLKSPVFIVGLAMATIITVKLFGPLGAALEFVSVKSMGVIVLSLLVLRTKHV